MANQSSLREGAGVTVEEDKRADGELITNEEQIIISWEIG